MNTAKHVSSWRNAMHTTHLRKVGGSVMLTVPLALLDILHLQPGAKSILRLKMVFSS
jgi:hypothetical protein